MYAYANTGWFCFHLYERRHVNDKIKSYQYMYTLSYMIVPLLNARDNYLTNARLSIKGNTLTPKDILELGSPGCGLGTYKYMSVRLH